MKKRLMEKMLNKLGYIKKDSLIQPVIIKKDILQGRKLTAECQFTKRDFAYLDEVTIKKIVTRRFENELYKYCDFEQEPVDERRDLVTITATLNLLERME